ncbi:hypothetical protein LIA77_04668 [Sarocladium implicatum]|nr:hypothetical protein LIA77_04668 [Sarocladium implicatum]
MLCSHDRKEVEHPSFNTSPPPRNGSAITMLTGDGTISSFTLVCCWVGEVTLGSSTPKRLQNAAGQVLRVGRRVSGTKPEVGEGSMSSCQPPSHSFSPGDALVERAGSDRFGLGRRRKSSRQGARGKAGTPHQHWRCWPGKHELWLSLTSGSIAVNLDGVWHSKTSGKVMSKTSWPTTCSRRKQNRARSPWDSTSWIGQGSQSQRVAIVRKARATRTRITKPAAGSGN